jgi:hypothetical protein
VKWAQPYMKRGGPRPSYVGIYRRS